MINRFKRLPSFVQPQLFDYWGPNSPQVPAALEPTTGIIPNMQEEWAQGRKYMTKSGHRVRSKIEKIIADFFTDQGVSFVYEPEISIGGVRMCPDFHLPRDDIYYEHFGLANGAYLSRAYAKIDRYQKAGVKFFYTTVEDEPDIEDVIVDQLAIIALGL